MRRTAKLNPKLCLSHLQQLISDQRNPRHGMNSWRHIHQIQQVSLCPSFTTIHAIAFIQIQRGWQCSLNFQEQGGRGGGSVRAMRHEFPWKCPEFSSFVFMMGIMTRLLDVVRPVPSGSGLTTPSQPGHYPLSNNRGLYWDDSEYRVYRCIEHNELFWTETSFH